jgi:hypothetical protein
VYDVIGLVLETKLSKHSAIVVHQEGLFLTLLWGNGNIGRITYSLFQAAVRDSDLMVIAR